MNERIGQLAEQAGLLGPSSRVGNSHQATEKFAELLIQDIANVLHDNGLWNPQISQVLSERFRVEE